MLAATCSRVSRILCAEPFSEPRRTGRPRGLGSFLHSAQSGIAAFHTHVRNCVFRLTPSAASPDRLVAFQQSMVARSQGEAADLLRAHDFSGYQHVIDVGGGFGVTVTAILTAYPALRATLFDRPEVTQAAHARLTAAGVDARCTVVAGDALDAVPRGGDLDPLSRVIHDWHDDDAVRISGHAGALWMTTPASCWSKPSLPTSPSISRARY